jgi:hypothetical protein
MRSRVHTTRGELGDLADSKTVQVQTQHKKSQSPVAVTSVTPCRDVRDGVCWPLRGTRGVDGSRRRVGRPVRVVLHVGSRISGSRAQCVALAPPPTKQRVDVGSCAAKLPAAPARRVGCSRADRLVSIYCAWGAASTAAATSCRRPRVTLGHARGPSRLASAALLRELRARGRRADRGAVAPPAVLYVRRLSSRRACDGSNHRHSACNPC